MIFDRLATIAERHYPKLVPVLRRAQLFVFPGVAHQFLRKDYTSEEITFAWEHFFLPFPVVAVEDPGSVVILWDETPGQQGMEAKRYFVEGLPLNAPEEAFQDGIPDRASRVKFPASAMHVNIGWIRGTDLDPKPETKFKSGFQCSLDLEFDADKTSLLAPVNSFLDRNPDRAIAVAAQNARAALEEVMHFNAPNRFVVEREPLRRDPRTKRVPRSDARSIYELMTVTEIRGKLRLPEPLHVPTGNGSKKAPHMRRAHFRKYPDDPERWPKAHGQVRMVPASWVGPSEAKVGRHYYRVRLDL